MGAAAQPHGLRAGWTAVLVAAAFALASLWGCGTRSIPKQACVIFYASEDLNLYDGEPHPVTVYVYPLSTSSGFLGANVSELLEGELPKGILQPPVPITVSPDEKRAFEEMFPAETSQLGVLADYYRAPGESEGTRTLVVPARCGYRKPKLALSSKNLERK